MEEQRLYKAKAMLERRKLKVKIKSLAEESRIIRIEERKLKRDGFGPSEAHIRKLPGVGGAVLLSTEQLPKRAEAYLAFLDLRGHRKYVGQGARLALIAYGYIRGRRYNQVETPKTPLTDRQRQAVTRMTSWFGVSEQPVLDWLDGKEPMKSEAAE